jgi:signal transduction histidine kinase
LRWYVDRYTKRTGLNVDVLIDLPDENERFSRELETACFRIAQEALTNVVRHAKASQVTVRLTRDADALLLTVKDDGIGFDVDRLRKRAQRVATLGLISMQERAHAAGGTIELDSAPANGTEIRFSLPLDGKSRDYTPGKQPGPSNLPAF